MRHSAAVIFTLIATNPTCWPSVNAEQKTAEVKPTAAVASDAAEPDVSDAGSQSEPTQAMELAEWIDFSFQKQWDAEHLAAPAIVDDAVFLRRLYLDLLGTIPSVGQAREFLDSGDEFKRGRLVDELLTDRRMAQNFGRVWRRVMVPTGSVNEPMGAGLEPWLTEQFAENVPYDVFARTLLTVSSQDATADGAGNSASALMFYQAAGGSPEAAADSVTRVFLGVRLGCAKCHDHPFADWKQADFWGMAAFFSGVQNGSVADTGRARIRPEGSDQEYLGRFLWSEDEARIPGGRDAREVLAEWLTSPENPNFAATAVNRVWQHLCGRTLAGQVDDLDEVAAEERAIVLDEFGERFVSLGYDLRYLIAGICKSRVYQRTTTAPASGDAAVAEVRPLKTLSPEQVFDCLEQALMLPVGIDDNAARYNGQRASMVQRLNEAFSDSPEEFSSGIPQALMMMNGAVTSDATNLDRSRTLRAVADAPFLAEEQKLETLFFAALTRKPTDRERGVLLKHLQGAADPAEKKQVLADIFWALLNSPEFVLNR
ncbi:MAG: DUF1549 domain-containing protein [Planctomycetaceae bacterium]